MAKRSRTSCAACLREAWTTTRWRGWAPGSSPCTRVDELYDELVGEPASEWPMLDGVAKAG